MTVRRAVGAVDSMWLNMDRPNNLMVIDSLMWFDECLDWDRLTRVVETRLLDRYPVFRQRPVSSPLGLGRQHWEDDPDFSLSHHMLRATLPAPGDQACLQRYVSSRMHQPLDRQHPLWEFHVVDGYNGGGALLSRFHHSIADGMALAEVLLSLTDATPTADRDDRAGSPGRARGSSGPVGPLVHGALSVVSSLPRLVRPSTVREALVLSRQTAHIADKLLLGTNPDSPLSGQPGRRKLAVWSGPRPVPEIKRVGRLAGATVNDVLVAAVSGAINAYLLSHGGDAVDLTTMVPVNLRAPDEPLPPELGNRFALVLLPLPTGVGGPLERLSETKRRMDRIKTSPEAVITFGLATAIGSIHPSLERLLVDFFASKAIGVLTNVIGPMTDRYVAGTRISGVLGWVPSSGAQTVGVSIFSYDRTVRVGFKVDAGIVPDPERLVEAFDQEMDHLLRMATAV